MFTLLAFAPSDLLSYWTGVAQNLGVALAGIAALFGTATIASQLRANRRQERLFKEQQWRIAFCNLNLTQDAILTHPATPPRPAAANAPAPSPSQFLVFRLNVQNIGDGPVDVWGCFIAARELNTVDHREAYGGNIEWNDLTPYYFGDPTPEGRRLDGVSNTRHAVYSQEDYIQLDPKEDDTLTRIDRIDPLNGHVTLLYRVFLVGRGFGDLKGPEKEKEVRNLLDWQHLQQALFNISGPSFRILFNESDPLDRVADRDGWQCFMLYHKAFIDDNRNKFGWTHIDGLNNQLEGDPTISADAARRLCEDQLRNERARWAAHWEAFKLAVEECKRLPEGFADLLEKNWVPPVTHMPKGSEDDLTVLTAREAYKRLPKYLQWDPDDDDSLPVWEKFFLVSLSPDAPPSTLHVTAPAGSIALPVG